MSTSNKEKESDTSLKETWDHFGDAFKVFLKNSPRTYKQITELSGVSVSTLENWRKGRVDSPQWDDIVRVAAAMLLAITETNILLTLADRPLLGECQRLLDDPQADIPSKEKVREAIKKISSTEVSFGRDVSVSYPRKTPLERPQPAEYFRGREEELAELLAELRPGQVVTLCGPGGIGKTALAAKAIWQLAPDEKPPDLFPDGIIYHNFYQRPQVTIALEHIAHSFGEEIKPTPKEAAQRALAGRRVLLLLDGTEEVDDLRLVLDIRNQCGVLITSRSRKDALAIRHDLPALPIEEAIAVLKDWGGRRVTNRETAQRISELVGQLPLALRLVGRYLSYTEEEASDYLVWLEKTPLAALDQGKRQEESVPLLLDRSVARLGKQARQILGIVGVIAFTLFTLQAIAAGLGIGGEEVHQPLGELVSYGLLVRPTESYEATHVLIHTYAHLQLAPPTDVVERLLTYYTTFVNDHQSEFDKLNSIRHHIIELSQNGSRHQAWAAINPLALAINSYLNLQGYWTDLITVLEAGLGAARAMQDRLNENFHLGNLGIAYYALGQTEQAIDYYQQALAIAKEVGNRSGESAVLGNLGIVYANFGQVEQAIDYYQQALTIAKEIGDRQNESQILINLGQVYSHLGQMEQAMDYHEQALAIVKEVRDPKNESVALHARGQMYAVLGQREQAIDYYQQALTIAKEIGDRQNESSVLGNLGLTYANFGQIEQAIDYYQQALTIAKEIGDRRSKGMFLGNLGLMYAYLGQVEQAIGYYQQALTVAKEVGNRSGENAALGNLGAAYTRLGQMEQAIDYYQQALTIAKAVGHSKGECNWLCGLGSAYYILGKMEQAIDYNQQALAIAKEIGYRQDESQILINLGLAYTKLEQIEQAIDYYQQALTIAKESGDRRVEGIVLMLSGVAYNSLGQIERTQEAWDQALYIFEEIKSPYTKTIRQWLSSRQTVFFSWRGGRIIRSLKSLFSLFRR